MSKRFSFSGSSTSRSAMRCGAVAAVFAAVVLTATTIFTGSAVPVQAQGNACVSACKVAHNQCRIATKGSASCDAQLQSCLQSCLKK